jgi:hypothetical protein
MRGLTASHLISNYSSDHVRFLRMQSAWFLTAACLPLLVLKVMCAAVKLWLPNLCDCFTLGFERGLNFF